MSDRLSYSTILEKYGNSPDLNLREEIKKLLIQSSVKLVILDDDPTGIQTVHGCLLLTNWRKETLRKAFEDEAPFFYILTNSRSMDAGNAEIVNRQVIEEVLQVNADFKSKLIFISRSDSTLRGHFPLEPDTIKAVLTEKDKKPSFPVFFVPAFFEAGRFTFENVHYLKNGDELIPVSKTEFARDNVFGYNNSDLSEYIVEKSGNSIKKEEIESVSIEELRKDSVDSITVKLSEAKQKRFIVVNALDYHDLQKFSLSFLKLALSSDNPAILRTSSSLPKAMSGIPDKELLTKSDLVKNNNPGIFIVGSHVQKTTDQLAVLLKKNGTKGIEVDVQEVLNSPEKSLNQILESIGNIQSSGKTPVIFTSRKETRLDDKSEQLNLGKKISEFLVSIVTNLPSQPAWIVAKGGITSHDVLTEGLSIESARVSGQIIAGVPVIITGKEHRFPELPYIIFPGNVGDENSLATVFDKLT